MHGLFPAPVVVSDSPGGGGGGGGDAYVSEVFLGVSLLFDAPPHPQKEFLLRRPPAQAQGDGPGGCTCAHEGALLRPTRGFVPSARDRSHPHAPNRA
eukprot:scaffold325_cov343-Pavlova_lutheri.AAC.5